MLLHIQWICSVKICIPECLEPLRTLDDEHLKFLYSASVPNNFLQMQRTLSSVLPKRVYPFSMQMHSKSVQRKTAKHKKTSRGKVSKLGASVLFKKCNLEANKKRSLVRKRIKTNSRHYTSYH